MNAIRGVELDRAGTTQGPGGQEVALLPARRSSILLLAHDEKKERLVDLAICYRDILVGRQLIATPTTARMIHDMVGLLPTTLSAGLDGTDAELVECVSTVRMAAVIFLVDPFTRRTHEPRLEPVLAACAHFDIPLATNIATAGAVLNMVSVLDAAESLPPATLRDK